MLAEALAQARLVLAKREKLTKLNGTQRVGKASKLMVVDTDRLMFFDAEEN